MQGATGGRGSFQCGQTAKARSGYHVQSLPEDAAASVRRMVASDAVNTQSAKSCRNWHGSSVRMRLAAGP
jgi:hypothetical protein